jgi:hypothetical protein
MAIHIDYLRYYKPQKHLMIPYHRFAEASHAAAAHAAAAHAVVMVAAVVEEGVAINPSATGSTRFITQTEFNNITPLADRLGATTLNTEGIHYIQTNYAMPVGYQGLRLGLNASELHYTVIEDSFSAVQAQAATRMAHETIPVCGSKPVCNSEPSYTKVLRTKPTKAHAMIT